MPVRDNASWLVAGLISAAVLFTADACGGDGSDEVSGGSIAFRQPTATPTILLQATVGPVISSGPHHARDWLWVKGVVIYLPAGSTHHMLIGECPPFNVGGGRQLPCLDELWYYVITRGESEVRIATESGKITKWDVAPEDEEEFNRLIREPLKAAGY
jgi:hypothetical protein